MAFTSMDIIKGKTFEADFYIREDNGIFIKSLSNFTSGTLEIRNIDTKAISSTHAVRAVTLEDGKHYIKLTIPANTTNTFTTDIEGRDDGYLHRSPYYGILTVNISGESPILSHIDKINIIEG